MPHMRGVGCPFQVTWDVRLNVQQAWKYVLREFECIHFHKYIIVALDVHLYRIYKPLSSKKCNTAQRKKLFSLYIVKYSSYQNCVHIKVAGLNKIPVSYAGMEMALQK
jgi:hypothetical protein